MQRAFRDRSSRRSRLRGRLQSRFLRRGLGFALGCLVFDVPALALLLFLEFGFLEVGELLVSLGLFLAQFELLGVNAKHRGRCSCRRLRGGGSGSWRGRCWNWCWYGRLGDFRGRRGHRYRDRLGDRRRDRGCNNDRRRGNRLRGRHWCGNDLGRCRRHFAFGPLAGIPLDEHALLAHFDLNRPRFARGVGLLDLAGLLARQRDLGLRLPLAMGTAEVVEQAGLVAQLS